MRITYRNEGHRDYWKERWFGISIDSRYSDERVYPLRQALSAIGASDGPILEAGCGAGRVVRLLQRLGKEVVGFDYIHIVVDKLKREDRELPLTTADVTALPYRDEAFSSVLAFGLLHNLPLDLATTGLREMSRVLQPGGVLCLSYRADNFQNWVNDFLLGPLGTKGTQTRSEQVSRSSQKLEFHKMNLKIKELRKLVAEAKLEIEEIEAATNMPLLYKFKFFRHKTHRAFNENLARAEGYRLTGLGNFVHRILMFFPNTFCNVYVVYARKK